MGIRAAALAVGALAPVLGAAGCHAHGAAAAHPPAGGSPVVATPKATTWASPAGSVAEAQPVRFALVTADGRRIVVTATGGGCTSDTHLFADESPDRVTLRLFGYAPPPASGTTCAANLVVMTRSVVLSRPLARRSLVDGSSGRTVAYFDGRRLAAVTWLPRDASSATDVPSGNGWVRRYSFPGHRTEAGVEISQARGSLTRGDLNPNPMLHVTRATVHGLPAVVTVQRDDRGVLLQASVTWAERGWRMTVASMPQWGWERPWSSSVLLRVAAGVRLPR